MKPGENIHDMQKHLIHIVNHLRTLRICFQNEDLVSKVLRCWNYGC